MRVKGPLFLMNDLRGNMRKAKGIQKEAISKERVDPSYKFEEERKRDARLIKGRFVNRECPGANLSFHYKNYKGDKTVTYSLIDGKEYELPFGVIRHLVNNCQLEETTNKIKLVDPNTYKPLYESKLIPRFSFVSSEFVA